MLLVEQQPRGCCPFYGHVGEPVLALYCARSNIDTGRHVVHCIVNMTCTTSPDSNEHKIALPVDVALLDLTAAASSKNCRGCLDLKFNACHMGSSQYRLS